MQDAHTVIVGVGLLAIAVFGSSAKALTLSTNGRTEYVIVLGGDATAAEKTAAAELRDHLGKVTGADFAIRNEPDVAGDAPQILVGPSTRAKQRCPKVDWAALGQDGIVMRTVGDQLVLAGGRPRGTLYAVYTFLEDVVGCRWWTSTEAYVPSKPTLTIGKLDTAHTPKLRYREAFYRDVNRHTTFAARLKCNGHFSAIPPSRGGHYTILGWCHTFYQLLPPDKHFAAHPEWYSEIDGKRSHDRKQLCLTNDEMRRALTQEALAWIRKAPDAGIIDISQNDWHGQCQCVKCRALEAAEGSPAGPLVHFVNAVAADIEKEFPGVLVQTLAYQYTRKPPLKVRPRKNVVIRLCSIECDFAQPLDSDANAKFRDDIKRWSAVAPNLAIWNYVTNFRNYILPHPNLRVLAPNLRFFVRHGAVSVFEQGDSGSSIGDFVRLRAWVLAHLMWDPSRDDKALIDEFLTGYYGPAGRHLKAYLELVHDAFRRRGGVLRCYHTHTDYLTPDELAKAMALFEQAAKAVAGDPVLARRVRRERLPLDHLRLLRSASLQIGSRLTGEPSVALKGPKAACEEYIRLAHEFDVGQYREGRPFAQYEPQLRRLFRAPAAPPDRCKELATDRWLDIQDHAFDLHGVGRWVKIVDDATASDGHAARMPGEHTQWACQWHVVPELSASKAKWRCYVTVRCQPKTAAGTAFVIGLYDGGARREVARRVVTIEQAADGKHHDYDLGTHELRQGLYFWVAPPGNADTVEAVYVDRIYLVREP